MEATPAVDDSEVKVGSLTGAVEVVSSISEKIVLTEETFDGCKNHGGPGSNMSESDPDPDPIVRVVGCHINVRKNGQLEVVVPGDEVMSQRLQHLLRRQFPQIKSKLEDPQLLINDQ